MAEYDSVIPAGQSGKITARVRTNTNQQGRVRKSIQVVTDAVGAEALHLTMSFDIHRPIEVMPRPMLYLHGVQGEEVAARVLLRRTDGEPLEIREVTGGHDAVKVTTRPADGEEEAPGVSARAGDVWLEASLSGDGTGAATRSTKLVLQTNHPEQPQLALPLTVRILPRLQVSPDQIRLWVDTSRQLRPAAMLRITHNQGRSFALGGLSTSLEKVVTLKARTGQPATTHTVRLDLRPELDLAALELPLRGSVTVELKGAGQSSVEVPVVIADRSRASTRQARPQRRPLPVGSARPHGGTGGG